MSPESDQPELYELAKQAVEVCGSIEDAIEWLRDAVDAEKGRRRKRIVDECVRRATADMIYDVRHVQRTKAKAMPGNAGSHHGPGTYAELTSAHMDNILDSWSTDLGKCLGDATGTELVELAQKEYALAAGHRKNAAFYELLAKQAGEQTVREVVGAEDARKLWERVSG